MKAQANFHGSKFKMALEHSDVPMISPKDLQCSLAGETKAATPPTGKRVKGRLVNSLGLVGDGCWVD